MHALRITTIAATSLLASAAHADPGLVSVRTTAALETLAESAARP
jgi:hypothetical protein